MKMGIAALSVMLALIITLSAFSFYLEDGINEIIYQVENTDFYLQSENYQAAFESYKKAHDIWNKKEKNFALHLEHPALDEINQLFAELDAYFHIENFPQCSKTCNILIFSLEHIIAKNKVNLETIL